MSDPIERLSGLFERFPGIGPRQAHRFVQHLLRSPAVRRELSQAVADLGGAVRQCAECQRFYAGGAGLAACGLCAAARDRSLLAIVASDADLAALERSGTYRGRYFVFGGTISLVSQELKGLRLRELLASVPARAQAGLREVILAFPANPEGDTTAARIREELAALAAAHGFSITMLGRGLSTGSELEYADPETLKSALSSRR